MARDDLVQEIQTRLYNQGLHTDETVDIDINCNCCGETLVERDRMAGADYIVHRVPEHGTETIKSIYYCSRQCFNSAMGSLVNNESTT